MSCGSIHALAHAFREELDRIGSDSLHRVIHISTKLRSLQNGMKHCSVQVECKAGCGWLVESYGREAEILKAKADVIKKMIEFEGLEPLKPSSVLMAKLFPELQEQPAV